MKRMKSGFLPQCTKESFALEKSILNHFLRIDKRGEDGDGDAFKAWARAPVRRSDWDAIQEYGRVIKRRSPYYMSNPVVEPRDVDLRLPGSWRIM